MKNGPQSLRNIRWRIEGTLTTTSPLHIGSGEVTTFNHPHLKYKDDQSNQVLNDIQAVVKDYRGVPCIPGSALKGVLRSWAEQMLPNEQQRIRRIFGAREIAGKNSNLEAGWAEFCTSIADTPEENVCMRFSEYVPYWNPNALTGILSHVCIDRDLGTAAHNKLFFEEFVPECVTFKVEIDATRLTQDEISLLLAILEQGAIHSTHPYQFGANGADGWGRMKWNLGSVKRCDDSPDEFQGIGFDCCAVDAPVLPARIVPQEPSHVSMNLMLACNGPFLVNDASRTIHSEMSEAEKEHQTNFTPMRRENGRVWLPVSSLRGALRERTEFLLRSLNCRATGDPNNFLGDGPIERIFGKTSEAARLQILECSELGETALTHQDFVAIDRFRGGAADGAKFDASYADRPRLMTRLVLSVNGLKSADIALFRRSLEDVCKGLVPFGWGGAKGFGQFTGTLAGSRIHAGEFEPAIPTTLFENSPNAACQLWINELLQTLFEPQSLESRSTAGGATGPAQVSTTPQVVEPAISYEGNLVWQGKDKKRRRVIESSNNKNPYQLKMGVLRSDLQQATADSIPVEFVLVNGQPNKVRPKGEPWDNAPISLDHVTNELQAPFVLPQIDDAGFRNRFANPYSFVRMVDRANFSANLSDAEPVSHARLESGRYSGKMRIKLTAKTPLLICDHQGVVEDDAGHKTYRVRLKDSIPDLASSSVRGMLRSAYEAITNSRFGVFPSKADAAELTRIGNARQPGYRMNVDEGLGLVPIRIANGQAFLMRGRTNGLPVFNPQSKKWKVPGDLYAAWVPQYEKDISGYAPTAVTIDGRPPKHRQMAWCWLEKITHRKIPMSFWRVREAALTKAELSEAITVSPATTNYSSLGEMIQREGYFVVSNQNIKNKHDERFFFADTETEAVLPQAVLSRYRSLIEDCQDIHRSELEDRARKGASPELYTASVSSRYGKTEKAEVAAMSRHSYESVSKIDPGMTLCYGLVSKAGSGFQITSLYPVMISRKLYEKSPLDLCPESLRPAADIRQLSPADRLFGWVNQNSAAQGEAKSAYRSSIRFGPIRCLTESAHAIDVFLEPKTLAILGQPKPQQGRFYVGDKDGKSQSGGLTKEQAGYTASNRLRGQRFIRITSSLRSMRITLNGSETIQTLLPPNERIRIGQLPVGSDPKPCLNLTSI